MFKGLLFFLRQGLKHDAKYILWLFLNQLVQSLIPVSAALLPKLVLDELTGAGRVPYLLGYVFAFSACLLLSQSLSTFFAWDGFTHRCRVDASFGFELHAHLARADYAQLENPAFADMQQKAQRFLTCDYHGFGYLLDCAVEIMGRVVTLLGLIALLSTLEAGFLLLFALLAAVCAFIEGRTTKKIIQFSLNAAAGTRKWTHFAGLFEKTRFAKEIRLHGAASWLLSREREAVGAVNSSIKAQNDCRILAGTVRAALSFVQQCVAYIALIFKVLSGTIGIGSFTMCVSAVTSFADTLRRIMERWAEIRAYDFYYAQLDEYLSLPQTLRESASGNATLPTDACCIELRDVGFRYPGAKAWALRHVNLTIMPHERLALVGENGSGKSTLIKLLCRLYDPTEGAIYLNGTDIRAFAYDDYLSLFSTVFQDFALFDCSLRDNLLLGRKMDDSQLKQILEKVGLAPRVSTLPHGLDTFIGRQFDQSGFEPSGGEAQKIALARALCKDAPIVVLDEPTAALDPRSEAALYRQFDQLTGGKTSVYISHRLTSCRFCDRIAVLRRGELVELGTHDTLLAHGGEYANLYSACSSVIRD